MYIPNFGDKPTLKFNAFGKNVPPAKEGPIKYKNIKKWRTV